MKKIFLPFLLIFIFGTSYAGAFTDTKNCEWATDMINKWASKGIITGYSDGTFRGNESITRAELITIVNRLNNSNETVEKRPSKDITTDDWYFNAMGIALRNGLIELDKEGNLYPKRDTTREETFVILAKLFNLKTGSNVSETLGQFSDMQSINYKAMPYVSSMVKAGYAKGYADGTIRPQKNITRVELVSVINNMIGELYTSGKYSNKTIEGNIVINGEDIELFNIQTAGGIFVMKGAANGKPILKNVMAGAGIVSKVGTITNDIVISDWETLATVEPEREKVMPVFAKITYSESSWTNEEVTATITFENSKMRVVNNSGKRSYVFEKNGEFAFECEDEKGNNYIFRTKVDSINRAIPDVTLVVTDEASSASIVATAENGDTPIDGIYYIKGNYSAAYTVDHGIEFNDTFSITDEGTYTVAAEDEAGNLGKETFEWEATASYTISEEQTVGAEVTPATLSVEHGENAELSITANTGYTLTDVLVDGLSAGAVTSYTFTNVKSSHEITAVCTPIAYGITYDLAGGTVSGNPTGYDIEDADMTLNNPILPGYTFTGWTGSNGVIPEMNVTIESGSTGDKNYTANWEVLICTMTVIQGENGTISPSTIVVSYGSDQTFAITPDAGYEVDDVEVDGTSVGAVTSYTFTNVVAVHSIEASYTPIVYSIVYNLDGGTAVGNLDQYTIESSDIPLNNPVREGYIFAGWTGSNGFLPELSVTITNGSIGNKNYAATWDMIVCTITVIQGANGVISPSTITLNYGSDQTFTITPDSGYEIEDVLVDDVSIGPVTSDTFTNITGNHKIEASYIPIIYTITYNLGGGTAVGNPTQYTVESGNTTLNNPIITGYTFTGWTGSNGATPELIVSWVSHSIGDRNYIANWEIIVCTITVTQGANGTISPATAAVSYGSDQTFTITPDALYQITDVLVDGVSVGAVTSYTFTNITTGHSIEAVFGLI